jgi:general secretion pathway protein K
MSGAAPVRPARRAAGKSRRGSALIITLWVLIVLSLLMGTFAFDMTIEAGIASYARRRVKAQHLAKAGVEYSKALLLKKVQKTQDGELILEDDDDEMMATAAVNLSRGVGVSGLERELGEGTFSVDILPEEGRRNVNRLTDRDWEEILDQSGIPEEKWAELVDCFNDWVDEGDEHRLNGAESEDKFYKELGYKCKNGPLDTVDELLLIKGFTHSVVFGGPAEDEDEPPYRGIAQVLTTWGDGKVNVNTAGRDVLMTLPDIPEEVVEDILRERAGVDGEMGTVDDGFENIDEVISKTGLPQTLRDQITTVERKYLRVISIGEVKNVKYGIWAVMLATQNKVIPVFWREEQLL